MFYNISYSLSYNASKMKGEYEVKIKRYPYNTITSFNLFRIEFLLVIKLNRKE